jgi:hypothetical protein
MVVMNARGQNMFQIQLAIESAHSVMNISGVNHQGIQKIASDMRMVASLGNAANPLALLR